MKNRVPSFAVFLTLAAVCLAVASSLVHALDQDEKMIWADVEKEQKRIARSGLVYEDEKLTAYLNGVLARLVPAERVPPNLKPKVVVLKSRYMNAFAFPDGTVYIHSCMLARLDSEAQLATLLGHEITHALNRHTVKSHRDLKSKTSFLASITVVGAWVGAGLFGAIGTTASITGYSRELETEADMEGLAMMVKAGYDPSEALGLFDLLEAEAKEEDLKEHFFFGSHPRLQDRRESCTAFLKTNPATGGSVNREAFAEALRDVVLDSARLELKAGRFKAAEALAEKYCRARDSDPNGYYVLGEVFRQRAEQGDEQRAREHYTKAISLSESFGEAYRALGLISLRLKENTDAKRYFGEYLNRSPKAADRGYIEKYLKELE